MAYMGHGIELTVVLLQSMVKHWSDLL